MSRLFEYRTLESELEQQLAKLKGIKGDPSLVQEMEFETKLRELLTAYGKGLRDIIALLDPGRPGRAVGNGAEKRTRRPRQTKVYRNPLTGEVVESKGGNNKLLGAWKAQFGHDEVESWVKP